MASSPATSAGQRETAASGVKRASQSLPFHSPIPLPPPLPAFRPLASLLGHLSQTQPPAVHAHSHTPHHGDAVQLPRWDWPNLTLATDSSFSFPMPPAANCMMEACCSPHQVGDRGASTRFGPVSSEPHGDLPDSPLAFLGAACEVHVLPLGEFGSLPSWRDGTRVGHREGEGKRRLPEGGKKRNEMEQAPWPRQEH